MKKALGILLVSVTLALSQATQDNIPSFPNSQLVTNVVTQQILLTSGTFDLPGYGTCHGYYMITWQGDTNALYYIQMKVHPAWQWSYVGQFKKSTSMMFMYPINATNREFRVWEIRE